IGSGPAGLSAAARAAEKGVAHVLLERTDHLSDTIYKYQKRKHVMAHPEVLPLRSDVGFNEGSGGAILGDFDTGGKKTNVRYHAEVKELTGSKGGFEITLQNGEKLTAEHVVLSIGVQGNVRKLSVPGDDWDRVQYQLDDPDEY